MAEPPTRMHANIERSHLQSVANDPQFFSQNNTKIMVISKYLPNQKHALLWTREPWFKTVRVGRISTQMATQISQFQKEAAKKIGTNLMHPLHSQT
jgi:hypothetical protein